MLPDECPRCRMHGFDEHDSGPDAYEDDITWTSWECTTCHLWYSDLTGKWYDDVLSWQDEQPENEYVLK